MSEAKQSAEDLAILKQLNLDYHRKREGTWVCFAACAPEPVPVA